VNLKAPVIAALGGAANVRGCEFVHGRVLLMLADAALLDRAALAALGVRAIAEPGPGRVHLLHATPGALRADAPDG
jgi:phosphotransferase system IIB component